MLEDTPQDEAPLQEKSPHGRYSRVIIVPEITKKEGERDSSQDTRPAGGKDRGGPGLERSSRVPDGGFGWLVVGGSFITMFLLPLLSQGFGVIFSRYLLQEGSSSVTNAWIFNIHSFIWNVMGLLVRPLAQEFGWRSVAMAGCIMASVALMLSAFTPSPWFLFLSFSLLSGAGGGLVVCMSLIIVPSYFERRRGLANAVMMAGVCTGQMVGPPLIRLLQDRYGYKGATLLLGAIILNSCVGAIFFHPVEWHLKRCPREIEPPEADAVGDDAEEAECDANGKEEAEWVSLVSPARGRKEDGTPHESEDAAGPPAGLEIHLREGPGSAAEHPGRKVGLGVLLMRVARSTLTDLSIMRSPRALIIALGSTFFIIGFYNFVMMVPFAMQIAGHSLKDAANCISVSAMCNLVMRMLVSALSDCSWFNMRLAYMTGLALTSSSILVFPLVGSVRWLTVIMAVWGIGVGTTMSLYNLVMVKFMGLENLAPAFGAASFSLAVGFLTIGSLIGVVRDVSGSYTVSMSVLSGYVFVSFVLWVFMPAAQAYDQRKKATQAPA